MRQVLLLLVLQYKNGGSERLFAHSFYKIVIEFMWFHCWKIFSGFSVIIKSRLPILLSNALLWDPYINLCLIFLGIVILRTQYLPTDSKGTLIFTQIIVQQMKNNTIINKTTRNFHFAQTVMPFYNELLFSTYLS